MQLTNFLPPKLTSGEARDIGPHYITADDLTPIRDKSAECVSQSRQAHVPIEEPVDPVLPTEQEVTVVKPDAEMVTRRKMMVGRFLPNTHPSTESQQPQGKGRTLPPPSSNHAKKNQSLDNQSPKAPGDAPSKTLTRPSSGIMIRELVAESQSTTQASANVASYFQPVVPWQPTFKFGVGPLLATASATVWDKGEEGRVAQSLVHGVLLPKDVRFFSDGDEDSLVQWLQWHTVAVISLSFLFHLFKYMNHFSILTLVFVLPVRADHPHPW